MMLPDLWSLLHAPVVDLLGWTLLHFVWQGALVAAALAGALYILRAHPPRVRYAVSCAAFAGLLALPLGTAVLLSGAAAPSAVGASPSMAPAEATAALATSAQGVVVEPSVATSPSWQAWMASWVRPALPWVVLAWGLGVIGFAVRLGGGAWRVRRLRRTSAPVSDEWTERLRRLANQMGVRASVALRQSDRIEGPVLAGWWRPVILVPAGFLSGLPPNQVEALLRHELAHVRRHDVLVGRLQAVMETLLFFHPATWWISAQVRRTREACCDDLVVQAGSDRRVYAEALTTLAERAVSGATAWAPAAADGSLLHRIRRLVAPAEAASTTGRRLSIVAAALLMVLVPAGLAACASQQPGTEARAPDAPAAERPDDEPDAPDAASTDGESQIVVVGPDSTERRIVIETPGPVEVERLDEGGYVLRSQGEVDTIDVPSPEALYGGGALPFAADSLAPPPFRDIDPDSLERYMSKIRRRADSIAQHFAERFPEGPSGPWGDRDGPDSTEWFGGDGFDPDNIDPDALERDDLGLDLDVDSLIRHHERRADSLRRRFERMRERIEENRSEHLRERARRLREWAERLEERAEEMDEQAAPAD